MLLWWLWLLVPLASGRAQRNECTEAQKNNFGDYIVSHLHNNYPDGILVDDISSQGSLGNKIEAHLGVMRSMKSLRRIGDVSLNSDGPDIKFGMNITFGDLVVDYEEYKFTALGLMGFSQGTLTARAYENLIELQVQFSDKSVCYIEVNDIIIHKLEDFQVQMRSFNKISQKIGTSVGNNILRFYKDRIRFDVHTRLMHAMPKVIRPNRYICRHLRDNY